MMFFVTRHTQLRDTSSLTIFGVYAIPLILFFIATFNFIMQNESNLYPPYA